MKRSLIEGKFTKRLIPYQWPWTDNQGNLYPSIGTWAASRKFSLLYIIASVMIVAGLGFASRSNCDGPWQIVFQCNWTMWMGQFHSDFWHFLLTCFTTAWFHNDLPHILFVAFFGFMFPVQSFEVQHGTKMTVILYFAIYLYIGLSLGACSHLLKFFVGETEFVIQIFKRSWMGGSAGIFGIIGAMANWSKKTWFLLALIVLFEVFSYNILGNNIYISIVHLNSTFFGFLFGYFWYDKKRIKAIP